MEQGQAVQIIEVDSTDDLVSLFGKFDENISFIESELLVNIFTRDTVITIRGNEENALAAKKVVEKLLLLIQKGEVIDRNRITYAIDLVNAGEEDSIEQIMGDVVAITAKGKQIKCKTVGQKKYVNAIRNNTVVFGVGPAGTGKTYLAVAMAVVAYKSKQVSKIILTRPAVEAGEKLGFLPGDLQDKVDPYLRPLYDALFDFFGAETYQKLQEKGIIEVAPLAYMRGRTLADAFIILDEAQNSTVEQMKMFLTRFGDNSKVVVTGDITQIDLPKEKRSGLKHAVNILNDIEDISIINLTYKDVVRHRLVQSIIKAYEKNEKKSLRYRSEEPK